MRFMSLRRDQLQTEHVVGKRIAARFSMDVSNILTYINQYQKGEGVATRIVQFGRLKMFARLYPKGSNAKDIKNGFCSYFLYLINPEVVYGTAMTTTIKCGTAFHSFTNVIDNAFATGGYGHFNFCTIEHLRQNPTITVSVQMIDVTETGSTEAEQKMEDMYKFNQMDGDVTLLVVANEDIDSASSQEPPLKKQKLNESESQSESQLDQKENEIKVSSILLKSASPVFRSMLSNDMMEKKEKKITVISESVQNVDDMVYFMCTGKLRDSVNAFQVMKLAHFYQMEIFRISCIDRMIETLSVENFVDTVKIFDQYAIKKGYQELIDFGKDRVEELKNSAKLDELPFSFRMCALGMINDN